MIEEDGMNQELYRACVVPAREAPDGETPTLVIVTEENNGYAVFLTGHNEGTRLLLWTQNRSEAIGFGVRHADGLKRERDEYMARPNEAPSVAAKP